MPQKFLQNITPRAYQQAIFETAKEKNTLVVLPTGLGKTLIALMLTIDRMKKFPHEKVVFLAPTKPLAEQHQAYYKKHLPELFGQIELFTGNINAAKRKQLWQNADIVFSTPQCVGNDIKKGLYTLEDVSLLVEDEAHRCINNYAYNAIVQTYKNTAEHPRVLGLTASPGSSEKKIKDICKNLAIESVELRTRESPDVKPYLQELEYERVFLDFPKELEEIRQVLRQMFDDYVGELRNRKVLFGPAYKVTLIELQRRLLGRIFKNRRDFQAMLGVSACAQAIKLQHALELLETQTLKGFLSYLNDLIDQANKAKSKGVQKLVNKPAFTFIVDKTKTLAKKGFEHPKINKLLEIVAAEKEKNPKLKIIIFTQFRETATTIAKHLNALKTDVVASVFVGQAKKKDTGMTQKEQHQMIQDFSAGKINALCATCIAEEGLDIPEVNIVLFYEPIPSVIRTIQRAGRTARLQEGKVMVMITKKTRDEAHHYSAKYKERHMHKAIANIQERLNSGKSLSTKSERQGSL